MTERVEWEEKEERNVESEAGCIYKWGNEVERDTFGIKENKSRG